jgi:hypothetical protein
MKTMTYSKTLVVKCCPVCGIDYAIPDDFNQLNDERGRSWFCPNGHSLHFVETELAKAKKQAAELERRLDAERTSREFWRREEERTRRKLAAAKGQATKARKRAAKGVCPHPECHRSFVDVARHVRNQHPELADVQVRELP